ncbi:hypothetical protein RCH06_000269 [Polaromonas sp. CG_9.5]|nr:hypothetical protein [Polaromonas sp. CG_9.5]
MNKSSRSVNMAAFSLALTAPIKITMLPDRLPCD